MSTLREGVKCVARKWCGRERNCFEYFFFNCPKGQYAIRMSSAARARREGAACRSVSIEGTRA
jgi:hypothetical protein